MPFLYKGAVAYENYYYLTGFPQFAWCDDIDKISEFNELKTQMNDYIEQAKIQFITGTMDLDADWDAYPAQINNIGLERYLELAEIVNFG